MTLARSVPRIAAAAVLLALGSMAVPAGGAPEPARTGRNIIVISIDTLRADHLGCYGYFRDTSPNLDALAKPSVFFDLCLTPIATTLPAHTSLFTGVYPIEHGLLINFKRTKKPFVPVPALRSFAQFAQDRGYETAAFVSAAPVASSSGIAVGFDLFDEPQGQERRAEETNEALLAWVDTAGKKPFFLWVHYFDPHYPYGAPAPFDGTYETDEALEAYLAERKIEREVARPIGEHVKTRAVNNAYDGEIRYVDDHLGRLIARLKQRGLWEESAVILLSDHGESLGDHGMGGHGYIHREQLHVPLMMKIPGKQPRRVSFPMSLVDVLPTAIGLLGERELWSAFLDQASGQDVLASGYTPLAVFSQRSNRRRKDIDGPAYSMATAEWKYVHEPETRNRLFDWKKDPLELSDVLSSHAGVATELEKQLGLRIRVYEESAEKIGPPEQRQLDPETVKKLESLGYVEGD
jgi:arylsulfatase